MATVQERCKVSKTLQRSQYLVRNRAPSNVMLFRELVLLRNETARILEYDNYLGFKATGKMIGTEMTVKVFLGKVVAF